MAFYSSGVEYALHCLLYLVNADDDFSPSSRELAEFQGLSPSYVAKLFTLMDKSGLVKSREGINGGYKLAQAAENISVLQVVDAIEGKKPLFKCREIRQNCILYSESPPSWCASRVCQIHGVMLKAEQQMRKSLASETLAQLAEDVSEIVPKDMTDQTRVWFQGRKITRKGRGR